jgi:hypothetical protein
MKITIVPTSTLSEYDGVKCRIWKGQTESGISVALAVRGVIVNELDRQAEFERDLIATVPPKEDRDRPLRAALAEAIPFRMVL